MLVGDTPSRTLSEMKILYISQYFPPEIGAPAARVSELSDRWSKAGHDVTVLTGFPNHPTGRIHPDYRKRFRRLTSSESFKNVRVVRTWLWPLPNRKSWERIGNYTSFFISAIVRGLFLRRPEVIVATSPQLLVGLAGWALARLKGVPVVLEVRDIWPDAILAAGVSRKGSVLEKSLTSISRFLYKRCDYIVGVTPGIVEELVSTKDVPRDKIGLVMNGADPAFFSSNGGPDVRAQLNLEDKVVISFIGTIGLAYSVMMIVEAATRLKTKEGIRFLVIGEGVQREPLLQEAQRRRLKNLIVTGQKPREEIPAALRATDVCLILLKPNPVNAQAVPNRIGEYLAAGKAIIAAVEGEAKEILKASGAAICIDPENLDQLVSAIQTLAESRELRTRMGRSGRRYMEANMTRDKNAEVYLEILRAVQARSGGA